MSSRSRTALLLCLLACNSGAAATTEPSRETFQFAGLKRSFYLFTPSSTDNTTAPLLVLLHMAKSPLRSI